MPVEMETRSKKIYWDDENCWKAIIEMQIIIRTYLSKNIHDAVVIGAFECETFLVLHCIGILGVGSAFGECTVDDFSNHLELGLCESKDNGVE